MTPTNLEIKIRDTTPSMVTTEYFGKEPVEFEK